MSTPRSFLSLLLVAIFFGAIGCNPGIVDVPPPQVTDASAYFWSSAMLSAPISFLQIDSTTLKTTTITISKIADTAAGSFIIGQQGLSANMTCTIDSLSVRLSGISAHSLIPLPNNFGLKSRSISTEQTAKLGMNHVVAPSSGNVIASSNDKGVFYSLDHGQTWKPSSTDFTSNSVTAFAVLGKAVIAGTKSGLIYYSTNGGQDWLQTNFRLPLKGSAPSAIAAISANPNSNVLYVSNYDSVYRIENPLTTLSIGSGLSNAKNHRMISLAASDTISAEVIVGVDTLGGVYSRAGRTSDWAPVGISSSGNASSVVVTTTGRFYCSTYGGIYTSPDGKAWNAVTNGSLKNAMFAYNDSSQALIASDASGKMARVVDLGASSHHGISGRYVNDIAAFRGQTYAATDAGIYFDVDTGWVASSATPTTIHTVSAELPGEVVLLKSIRGTSVFDSTWAADTLVSTQQKNFSLPITGRVVGRLDSMSIGTTTYVDVIVVRYADEALLNSTASPYWVIYYGRGVGPLEILQMYGSRTLTKAIRQH